MFDVLTSEDVVNNAWSTAKQSFGVRDIHSITGRMVNGILHESMVQSSLDNLTAIVVTFENFDQYTKSSNPSNKVLGSEHGRRAQ